MQIHSHPLCGSPWDTAHPSADEAMKTPIVPKWPPARDSGNPRRPSDTENYGQTVGCHDRTSTVERRATHITGCHAEMQTALIADGARLRVEDARRKQKRS